MRRKSVFFGVVLCLGVASTLFAQDAVKVDPKHYTVITDNAEVRVLKVHYGPHEKSVMHSHPDTVAVFLTDGNAKFTFPDGKTQDNVVKAGDAVFTPAGVHLPENTGDKAFDVIVVELKGKSSKAPAKPAAKPAAKKK